jgi:hypothetical protein
VTKPWRNTKGEAACDPTPVQTLNYGSEANVTGPAVPARLTVEQTAVLLGFHEDAIGVLVKAGQDAGTVGRARAWGTKDVRCLGDSALAERPEMAVGGRNFVSERSR